MIIIMTIINIVMRKRVGHEYHHQWTVGINQTPVSHNNALGAHILYSALTSHFTFYLKYIVYTGKRACAKCAKCALCYIYVKMCTP